MQNNQLPPLQKLILVVCVSLAAFLYIGFTRSFAIGGIVSGIVVCFGIFGYFSETANDRKADSKASGIKNGTYFSEAEWREKYLNFKMNSNFDKISEKGMKYDLSKRYVTGNSIIISFLGAFLLVLDIVFLLRQNITTGLAGLAIFGFVFYIGVSKLTALPVRRFFSRNDIDFQAVSNSYMQGSMLSFKGNGINIGREYIVTFSDKKVNAININNVSDITKKVIRFKNYTNSIYTNEEYQYFAVVQGNFSDTIEIELSEFQLEMIIEEFHSVVGVNHNSQTDFSESISDDVIS